MSKKYVSNKDETVRMFENDFLEVLSRVHWTVPLWVYIPVVSYLLYNSFFSYKMIWWNIFLLFLAGLFTWTLTEYVLHRFVFHYEAKKVRLEKDFISCFTVFIMITRRIQNGWFMPPSVSIPLAAFFYFLFYFILGVENTSSFFAGFIVGYLFYDITHYAIHHFNLKNKFWLSIKNHHMLHHYKFDNLGFGVSQPFWDYVFGTTFPKKER